MSASTSLEAMSPLVERPPVETTFVEGSNEFGYKPVPPLAPLSVFLGICSVAGLFGLIGLAICAVGVLVGGVCLWQIRRAEGELGGRWLARAGFCMSLASLLGGSAWQGYVYATEVPEGYERVSFNWMAKEPLKIADGEISFSPAVKALDGRHVYLKGYMYLTRQDKGLRNFILCKDSGDCCFGGQTKPTDMIIVEMQDGQTVDGRQALPVGVGGVLRLKPIVQGGQVSALFTLEGTHFR